MQGAFKVLRAQRPKPIASHASWAVHVEPWSTAQSLRMHSQEAHSCAAGRGAGPMLLLVVCIRLPRLFAVCARLSLHLAIVPASKAASLACWAVLWGCACSLQLVRVVSSGPSSGDVPGVCKAKVVRSGQRGMAGSGECVRMQRIASALLPRSCSPCWLQCIQISARQGVRVKWTGMRA